MRPDWSFCSLVLVVVAPSTSVGLMSTAVVWMSTTVVLMSSTVDLSSTSVGLLSTTVGWMKMKMMTFLTSNLHFSSLFCS